MPDIKIWIERLTLVLLKRPLFWVGLTALILEISGSWILPLMDRDEPRFAEASREMLQRHDWVIPWFNGQHRFDKPPLIYWCQAAMYLIFGESEFSARLPSILFTTATALLIFSWGKKELGSNAGMLAALGYSTSLLVLVYGRVGFADPAMVFFYSASCWLGWELTKQARILSYNLVLLFCLSLALGFLAKGPVAWLPMVGLAWLIFRDPALYKFGWGRWFWCLLGALVLVALWGVPALIQSNGEFFVVGVGHHVVERSFSVVEGHGIRGSLGWLASLPFYAPVWLLGMFPWSILLFKRWCGLKKAGGESPFGHYLMVQLLLVLVVFSFVRTKLPHYILPAIPLSALWIACDGTLLAEFRPRWFVWRFAGAGMVCLLVTLPGFIFLKHYFISKELYERAAAEISPDSRILSAGDGEPSIVWEFRRRTSRYIEMVGDDQWTNVLGDTNPCVVICRSHTMNTVTNSRLNQAFVIRERGRDVVSAEKTDLAVLVFR